VGALDTGGSPGEDGRRWARSMVPQSLRADDLDSAIGSAVTLEAGRVPSRNETLDQGTTLAWTWVSVIPSPRRRMWVLGLTFTAISFGERPIPPGIASSAP